MKRRSDRPCTWLNPHVYLDTILRSARYRRSFLRRASFATGAIVGSFLYVFRARLWRDVAEASLRPAIGLAGQGVIAIKLIAGA